MEPWDGQAVATFGIDDSVLVSTAVAAVIVSFVENLGGIQSKCRLHGILGELLVEFALIRNLQGLMVIASFSNRVRFFGVDPEFLRVFSQLRLFSLGVHDCDLLPKAVMLAP